tara:strand:+ start:497 stop:1507 length:1011 start_codon:yes stop_codon:yes gene_type:complete
MKIKKRVLLLPPVLICLSSFLFYQDIIHYGALQAQGQILILMKAQPITTYLNDANYPDSLKLRIQQIQQIKAYGEKIGLKPTDNYTSLYDQKNKASLWNLSACHPYKFENKTWSFPFLGSFGYKGFFDLSQARIERESLEKEGYDTRIRSVKAWSTLGWFKDPILSNMLNNSEAQIAETLFHELTHSTLFLKNQLQFNENLASFIGKKACIDYLNFYYGPHADQLIEYLSDLEDSERFRQHILRGKHSLDILYKSFSPVDNSTIKSVEKNKSIRNIVNHLDTITFSNSNYYSIFNNSLPNNTYFMSYTRYYAEEHELDSLFNFYEKNFKKFIDHFK